MTIKLRDYDLDTARERYRSSRVSRERGLVFDWRGDIKQIETKWIRQLGHLSFYQTSVFRLESSITRALATLPVEEGGTVEPVTGGYAARIRNVTPALPLVRALMVLRGHPCRSKFEKIRLKRPEQPVDWAEPGDPPGTEYDLGALLESYYVADPQPWDLARFESLIFEGARTYCGDVRVEPEWTPEMIYPGSRVSEYMGVLAKSFMYDAFGAFDPAFTRRDALVGEWWLLQPVSPRLSHYHLAQQFGLHHMGFLPPDHVDVEGRVVMACFPVGSMSDAHRVRLIEDSKYIMGWQKVHWTKEHGPLADPSFDLIELLEGVTEESYGPYRHATELPAWPER